MSLRLPLEQVLALHAAEKGRPLSIVPRDGGEFEVEAVDVRTGKRLWREVHHNLMTNWMQNMIAGTPEQYGYVFVSNDERPMVAGKDCIRATYGTTILMAFRCPAYFVRNVASRTWTFTGSIPVPPAGEIRNYRTVGICNAGERPVTGVNNHVVTEVIAATLLSELKTQTELTIININYRLAWEEAHNV